VAVHLLVDLARGGVQVISYLSLQSPLHLQTVLSSLDVSRVFCN
jgi:hypothetical protein